MRWRSSTWAFSTSPAAAWSRTPPRPRPGTNALPGRAWPGRSTTWRCSHQTGRGVPQDVAQALFWLEVAARLGEGVERDQAADAATRLTPLVDEDEAEAARARAEAFAPSLDPAPVAEAKVNLILSERQVETLQRRLAAHGYNPGPEDGIPGELTHSAVRRYLADRGLVWPEGELLTQRLLDLVVEP